MQRLCHPVPYGPMQRLCHPAHFFLSLLFVFQNHRNSISFHGTNRQTLIMTSSTMLKSKTFKLKLQISSPILPLLLFTLSHTPTHKLHYRSTPLSGYSAKFHCCKSRRTPCQPSGSTRCPISMAQGFAKETLQGRITSQASRSQTPFLPKKVPRPT